MVLEIDPQFVGTPQVLEQVQVIGDNGERIALSAFTTWESSLEQDRVQHDGQFAVESIGFSLASGVSLEQASQAIEAAMAKINLPNEVQGRLGGTAGAFQQGQGAQGLMLLMAIAIVYLVLGYCNESISIHDHSLPCLQRVGCFIGIQLTGGESVDFALVFFADWRGEKNAILMKIWLCNTARDENDCRAGD